MNLDLDTWKEFKIGKIFNMLNGKGITQEEIEENPGTFVAVQSGEENNGVMGYIDLEYCKEMNYIYSEKPCLTVARSGSAGFVSFQANGCVVGDSAKILLLPADIATDETYLFIQSVLGASRFKYTYGRKVTEDKYLNDYIKLPIIYDTKRYPVIDSKHRYSDDGYIPNWKFMIDYIKSLHNKIPTTKNHFTDEEKLDINSWREFKVGDIFKKKKVKHFSSIPEEIGSTPFVSSTSLNNGVTAYVNEKPIAGNCITVSTNGDCFDCFYHADPICVSNDVEVLYNSNLNVYNALFIISVLMLEKPKYSYGRKAKNDKVYDTYIKLPSTNDNEPDWKYMDNYIRKLPYGDRIEK